MAIPAYLGEIRIFAGNFAPAGWSFCNGQLLPISQNQALFGLLGKTYGGDGLRFALPDLRGRAAVHLGADTWFKVQGSVHGEKVHTLTVAEMQDHAHEMQALGTAGTTNLPAGNMLATVAPNFLYGPLPAQPSHMSFETIGYTGGSKPHNNMQPYLALYYIIALSGALPPR